MANRSIGKYCVVTEGRKRISCHKKLKIAKKKARAIGALVVDNLKCKANRGARCGMVYFDPREG